MCSIKPVTSLGHQEGRWVFWERPKSFAICPLFSNYIQHIFPGGAKNFLEGLRSPPACPWLRACSQCNSCNAVDSRKISDGFRPRWQWSAVGITLMLETKSPYPTSLSGVYQLHISLKICVVFKNQFAIKPYRGRESIRNALFPNHSTQMFHNRTESCLFLQKISNIAERTSCIFTTNSSWVGCGGKTARVWW